MRLISRVLVVLVVLAGGQVAPPGALAAGDRTATLQARARTLESGRILLEVTSDAKSVLAVWRTAGSSSQAAVLALAGGRAQGLVPKGSTRITAKALATAHLRASATVRVRLDRAGKQRPAKPTPKPVAKPSATEAVPRGSGTGRRIVWSKSGNRVWVMDGDRSIVRTFPVTDRDDLTPTGTYRVTGSRPVSYTLDESGRGWRLDHFVRFHQRCRSCSWIGFHAIPTSGTGQLIQPVEDLGTDRSTSHGCIRLRSADARYVYGFAVSGTKVVVVA